mmetsp:Transcript_44598/g.137621  ORF Transcript_44598/g.137621 Transcript_44598/m.137621 type:complete len:230 (-) Transcript_44598:2114-2803(-)
MSHARTCTFAAVAVLRQLPDADRIPKGAPPRCRRPSVLQAQRRGERAASRAASGLPCRSATRRRAPRGNLHRVLSGFGRRFFPRGVGVECGQCRGNAAWAVANRVRSGALLAVSAVLAPCPGFLLLHVAAAARGEPSTSRRIHSQRKRRGEITWNPAMVAPRDFAPRGGCSSARSLVGTAPASCVSGTFLRVEARRAVPGVGGGDSSTLRGPRLHESPSRAKRKCGPRP